MIGFGLQFPQDKISFEKLEEIFLIAERLGFDSAWLVDHFYSGYVPGEPVLECFTSLAALARSTKSIRIGPLVACNSYRHPPLTAKMIATIDVISKGRVEFGFGAGWYEEEYHSYGIPFPSFSVRIEQLREALQIIRMMWTEERVNLKGKYYSINNAYCSPKPIQKPYPPIWVGGRNMKVLKIAAEFADYVNLYLVNPEGFRQRKELTQEYCESIGRNPSEITFTWHGPLYLTENEQDAKAIIRKKKRTSYNPIVINMSFEEYFNSTVSGTAEEVLRKLQEFKDAGARYFIPSIRQVNRPDLLERISHEIVTPLKK